MVRYKLRITNGRCSHCTSPNVSRHYRLHTFKGLHKFKLSTRDFLLLADLSAMRMAVLPIHSAKNRGSLSRCNSPNASHPYHLRAPWGCTSLEFALVTSFLLANLQPCEWLSPHRFAGNFSSDGPKGLPTP